MAINSQQARPGVTQWVWVRFNLPGFHCYPDAPDEVAYLRSEHRHQFYFEIGVQTYDADREVEFHMMMNWLKSLFDSTIQINFKSCEMLADDILAHLLTKYGADGRKYKVTVSEDQECGSTLEYTPVAPDLIERSLAALAHMAAEAPKPI